MQYGNYEIVRYTPEYKDALLDLLALLWGQHAQSNAAYFHWKYEQNPYADRQWIYLALCEGQPVGVRGNLAMRWQVGNPVQDMDCMCDVDAVVKPEHRRRGLYEALTQFNIQDLERTSFRYIVTPNANAKSAAGNLKLAWKTVGPITRLIRLKPLPVARASKLRGLIRRIPLATNAYRLLRDAFRRPAPFSPSPPKEKSPFDILDAQKIQLTRTDSHISVEDAARPQPMADLVARLPADGRIRHVRDAEYFNWRYLNPRSNYRFLFWEAQRLEGYLILQTPARPGIHPVTIVDWEASDIGVQAELLKVAIELGDFDVLSTWEISLDAQIVELLLESGFVHADEDPDQENYQPAVLLRPAVQQPQAADWRAAGNDLLDLRCWDFRPIYSDTF